MAKTVAALFDRFEDAQSLVQELIHAGVRRDDIGLAAGKNLPKDEAGRYSPATGTGGARDPSGAGANAALGAALGGAAGLFVGLVAVAIPGIGPLLVAGPLVAALTGAGVGAAAGSLVGGLMDAGVSEEDANYYAEGVRRGGTLVSVRVPDELVERVAGILKAYHPVDLQQRFAEWQGGSQAGSESQRPV